MRGLGIGILVTAIVMSISLHGRMKPMTDEEVIERAKELGMEETVGSGVLADGTTGGTTGTESEVQSAGQTPGTEAEVQKPDSVNLGDGVRGPKTGRYGTDNSMKR